MKRFLIPTLLLALLLGACQGDSPGPDAATSPTPLAYATQEGETFSSTMQPTAASTQSSGTFGTPAGCTVVSPQPSPGSQEQSPFPPVSDQDWVVGPETASTTIIEYGDFQ